MEDPGEQRWLEARFAEIRPKAVAALTRQFRDLDLAEEVFSVACLKAVQSWPDSGLPDDPFAWLLVAGRNAGLDIIRKNSRRANAGQTQIPQAEPATDQDDWADNAGLRDDVLRLLFICCHPDLAPQDQLALALKIVAGLRVEEIAGAFLVKPKAMEQRITRAKKTVAAADIPFEAPGLVERGRRLKAVSLMLYLLFNEGWSASSGDRHLRTDLCEEAIRLARLLLDLFPSMSGLMGLLALFLFQHSRRDARLDEDGHVVTLEDQDRTLWDHAMIGEAQLLLDKSLRNGSTDPYQIQAAIASIHARAASARETDWREIERLYAALETIQPTPVVRLNRAAAIAMVDGPQAALNLLESIASDLENYRWFHAARASFLFDLGDYSGAKAAYQRTLLLQPTDAERRFLRDRIASCEKNLGSVSD